MIAAKKFFQLIYLITLSLVFIISILCVPAAADTVTIGGTNYNNGFPFTRSDYSGYYQQVYAASAFPGIVNIEEITFFEDDSIPGALISGNFDIYFSTTTANVNALSTTYSANLGSDNTLFFGGIVNSVLSFSGTPFFYDSSAGNLLMTVFTTTGGSGLFDPPLEAGINDALTSRLYNYGGSGTPTADNAGLRTEFTVSPIPEPTSVLLFGTGMAILLLGTNRRKRK